jgi:hypothetical protein
MSSRSRQASSRCSAAQPRASATRTRRTGENRSICRWPGRTDYCTSGCRRTDCRSRGPRKNQKSSAAAWLGRAPRACEPASSVPRQGAFPWCPSPPPLPMLLRAPPPLSPWTSTPPSLPVEVQSPVEVPLPVPEPRPAPRSKQLGRSARLLSALLPPAPSVPRPAPLRRPSVPRLSAPLPFPAPRRSTPRGPMRPEPALPKPPEPQMPLRWTARRWSRPGPLGCWPA